jgi:tRNA (mo5U34)-methyltransferase
MAIEFDRKWYLRAYAGVARSWVDRFRRYLRSGTKEGRLPEKPPWLDDFDEDWYLDQYPDVAAAGLNPLQHYLDFGAKEGRLPTKPACVDDFDEDWYLDQYPDVAAAGLNPLQHYLRFGAKEGRLPNKPPWFTGLSPKFQAISTGRHEFEVVLQRMKQEISRVNWCPSPPFDNTGVLARIMPEELDEIFSGERLFADIGAADGDLAFYFTYLRKSCDIVDFAAINFNRLEGARAMKRRLMFDVEIIECDIETNFELTKCYDFVFLLGILYHLKNPFLVLEAIAKRCRYMALSTKVCRNSMAERGEFSELSAAYFESNNDATNFRIFTIAELKTIIHRAGWDLLSFSTVGDVAPSNPLAGEHEQIAFFVVRSRHFHDVHE